MTIYVVLVMSNCHNQDTDRLWCVGLCQDVLNKDISNNIIFALKMSWH